MWDGLRKAAEGFLSEDTKARAVALAKRAHEAAAGAADKAGEAHKKWMDARAEAAATRQVAELAEAERQRALGEEHGFKAPLTLELKQMLGLPLTATEEYERKTAVEDRPPAGWFAPMGREMPVPEWLNARHPFFTGEMPGRVLKTGIMNAGGASWIIWQLQPRFTLWAATWFYESLIVRTLFERWKRGLPILTEDNRMYEPALTEDGFPIIDSRENEDGSVSALVAMPHADLAPGEERDAFLKLLGRYVFTPWKGKYHRHAVAPPAAGFRKETQLVDYSIGRPRVRTRVLKAADPDRNPYAPASTVHGSAQWEWRRRLAAGGLIDLEQPEALTGHSFLGRSVYRWPNGELAMNHFTCWGGEGHRLIVGPPGSGKFTCAIAPLLLWSANADSAFVLDVKNGEATSITAEHRATLGPVTVLDPFGITGKPSGAINPLDLLREDNPQLVATAERIADAIFVPSNSSDQHWDHAAKKTLAALLMHIGTSPVYEDGERNLKTLRNIVREHVPDEVLVAMQANEAGDGEIAAEARAMLAAEESGSDKYRFSVIASLGVNIGFLKVPEILAATAETTFDPRELREKVSTLYVVVPDHQLTAVSRWVRLIYTYVMEQLRETKGGTHVHVVLDEFPALGKFERVAQDMAQTRSLGVHMHVVVQTFQQLQEIYGRGWERFQGTSACTHVLGVRDNFTAEQISKMLGTTTVKTSGQSQTRGNSGGSQSDSTNYAARPLMTQDELLAMPAERCLAVIGGMNPIRLEKVGYYDASAKN
jgi:type IV secretion system protein VirD4